MTVKYATAEEEITAQFLAEKSAELGTPIPQAVAEGAKAFHETWHRANETFKRMGMAPVPLEEALAYYSLANAAIVVAILGGDDDGTSTSETKH